MPESFMSTTLRLMKESPQTMPEIYAGLRNQGSSITFSWLKKFSCGEISDPSVNRVEELHRYLTGKTLTEVV